MSKSKSAPSQSLLLLFVLLTTQFTPIWAPAKRKPAHHLYSRYFKTTLSQQWQPGCECCSNRSYCCYNNNNCRCVMNNERPEVVITSTYHFCVRWCWLIKCFYFDDEVTTTATTSRSNTAISKGATSGLLFASISLFWNWKVSLWNVVVIIPKWLNKLFSKNYPPHQIVHLNRCEWLWESKIVII